MCGVFGIYYFDGSKRPDAATLRRSADAIAHRGPDGTGVFAGEGIGLAHTRLSLVDLSERSDQPMWDQARRYCLVYNGEIYNFRELRSELEARGVTFVTSSDTEVLLQCLIHDGPRRTLPRLQGMFAFGFFDTESNTLVCARDRFGIKPLLLYQDTDCFMFASEAKALRPWIRLRANPFQTIRYLMNYGVPIRERGFFDDVEMLTPGTVVTVERGCDVERATFADLPGMLDPAAREELGRLSPDQAVDRVDELLQASIEKMLFADARVGALCSGGVDSSLLMAVAAKSHGDLAIFHADVVGRESELDAATALARHLKLDLLTVQVHDQDFLEYFPDVLYHYEHPFSGHPHSVPFLMVSKLVRESGVKGVLTGEGSDECFLGYNHLPYEPLWRAYERALATVRGIVNRIPTFGARLWPHVTRPDLVADMLSQLSSTRELQNNRAGYATRLGCPPDRNVRTLDLLSYHLRTLLHRNDTMGMAASIEARFPFLDEPLVAAAINFPYRYKIRFSARVWEQEHPLLRDKWVVRRVADRYLPGLLSQRKKWGFGVSAIRRLKVRDDYFRESFVQRHFRLSDTELDVFLAQADAAMRTKLVMLDAWGRLFVDDEPLHAEKQRLLQFGRIEEAA